MKRQAPKKPTARKPRVKKPKVRVDLCSKCGKKIVTEPASFDPEEPILCMECGSKPQLKKVAPIETQEEYLKNSSTAGSTAAAIPDPVAETYSQRQQSLADRLKAKKDTGVDNAPHLIVVARAGTGKTTTLVEGLKYVKGGESSLTPSPQQQAVWDALKISAGRAQTVCMVAFNKSIASELQQRVPPGCEASTVHSLGFKAVNRAFNRPKVEQNRVQDIICELTGKDIWELRKQRPVLLKAVQDLVGYCKSNLTDPTPEELLKLCSYYDVDTNGSQAEAFDLVPRVLERCKDVARDGCVDYDDMIWLPVVLKLPVQKYDLLLVDEAQDLDRCKQALVMMAGRRLVLCGDPRQAIYGFAGADADSMPRMEQLLGATERGVTVLPLTVTRRCGKAIVAEAQKQVPDFEAHETCPPGWIGFMDYLGSGKNSYAEQVMDGDFVLCRCNAPLVYACFRFLKAGRRATIQGRDIGTGIIRTLDKLMKNYEPGASGNTEIAELLMRLSAWKYAEERTENAKRHPSEAKLIVVQDKYDCLVCFCEGQSTLAAVKAKIESIFTDDKKTPGIRLSSIHKAKGMEAKRVFFIMPEAAPCPHPMAKSTWERSQENNLWYVAVTRAIEELIYVK